MTTQSIMKIVKLTLLGLHKVFVDDANYNSGHGHAFETIGITLERTTIVVVRPDQRESIIGYLKTAFDIDRWCRYIIGDLRLGNELALFFL